jgi:hypothetical protein
VGAEGDLGGQLLSGDSSLDARPRPRQ